MSSHPARRLLAVALLASACSSPSSRPTPASTSLASATANSSSDARPRTSAASLLPEPASSLVFPVERYRSLLPSWNASPSDFDDGEKSELHGLRCSLDRVHADLADGAIDALLVLENTGKAPVYLFELWNSWGAYQVRFAIVDASGARVVAGNPRDSWTRNIPSGMTLAPGARFEVPARIQAGGTHPRVFAGPYPFLAPERIAFPAKVRGVFDSRPLASPPVDGKIGVGGERVVEVTKLWAGTIATSWTTAR